MRGACVVRELLAIVVCEPFVVVTVLGAAELDDVVFALGRVEGIKEEGRDEAYEEEVESDDDETHRFEDLVFLGVEDE